MPPIRNAKFRKQSRERIKAARADEKEIRRYLERCDLYLIDPPPTREDLIQSLIHREHGESIKLLAFFRHKYTNYDEICAYVSKRWARRLSYEIKHNVLHPRVMRLAMQHLDSIGARDLLSLPSFAYNKSGQTA